MTEAEAELKTFTGAKLDLLDALSMDTRVKPNEFRLAFRLLQHLNRKTGALFPSQALLADELGITARQVQKCIVSLVDKQWLEKVRPNRQISNFYRFRTDNVGWVLDRQTSLADNRREQRPGARRQGLRRTEVPLKTVLTGTEAPVLTGTSVRVLTGTEVRPNTFEGTPELEHPQMGMEEGTASSERAAQRAPSTQASGARSHETIPVDLPRADPQKLGSIARRLVAAGMKGGAR